MKSSLIANCFKFVTLIAMLLFFPGCVADSPLGILFSLPECSIISVEKMDGADGGSAAIAMTVRNTGSNSTAYYVGCSIKLKRGNTIIDRGVAYFWTLRPGEAAIDEARFYRIEKHSEYDRVEYTLYWYDAEDGYYEE